MLSKTAEKLRCAERHHTLLVAARVVFPTKGDAFAIKRQKAVIADGYSVGIPSEIAQHRLRSAESRLGIDDLILAEQSVQECCELLRSC